MKCPYLKILLAVMLLFTSIAAAQEYPEWEGYPPLYSIKDIALLKGQLYCVTSGGIFNYDYLTREYDLYYKNHGLIDNDVQCVGQTSNDLFIGFKENGLWRFTPETDHFEQVIFPEYHIKTQSDPNGIEVLDIFAKDDNTLYIGHSNGIDVLNLASEELRTYTHLGPNFNESTPVTSVNIIDGKIWACTPQGVAVADEDNPNLEFEENWSNYTYKESGITSVIKAEDAGSHTIFLGTAAHGIIKYDKERNILLPTNATVAGVSITSMCEAMGIYWAGSNNGLYRNFKTQWMLQDEKYTSITALAGQTDNLWVGTKNTALQSFNGSTYNPFIPPVSGMRGEAIYDISLADNGVVWATSSSGDHDVNAVFMRYQDQEWTSYVRGDWVYRIVSILVDDRDTIWLGSMGKSGVYIFGDDGTHKTDKDTLSDADPGNTIVRPTLTQWFVVASDLASDKDGNVWIANYQEEEDATSGVVVVDGYPITRSQHYSPAFDGLPTAMIVEICPDEDGWIWAGTVELGVTGIYVSDDPYDKSDTEVSVLNTSDGLHSNKIAALAYDHDGVIWIGTEAGLNTITKKSNRSLEVESGNDFLEDANRVIHAIEIDRFNNKWIGTNGGLVKLNSSNTLEKVYSTDNSGLFTDAVYSLEYDNKNDILFIGTGSGMNVFDVKSKTAEKTVDDIHVYPNPFEIYGYDSQVVFTHLKPGSKVRIYTFDGILINELSAPIDSSEEYSELTWNGRNYKDNYVGSGVYYFSGISPSGNAFQDKMVLVRR